MTANYVYILLDESENLIVKTNFEFNISSSLKIREKRLVYFEVFENPDEAEKRKDTIKSWPEKKIKFLIDFFNPGWKDWKEEIFNIRLN